MLKNLSGLECLVDNKKGHFVCENDTPLHVAKEMMFQFLKYIGQVEDSVKAQQAEQQVASTEVLENVEPLVQPEVTHAV